MGIGFAISSHSAARGRFENGSRCCMWSDRRSRDAGYHHAVSARRPEKLNRILVLVNSERFSFVSSLKGPKLSAESIQILTNLQTKMQIL